MSIWASIGRSERLGKTREEMRALGWCDDCQQRTCCRICGNCPCDGHPCIHQGGGMDPTTTLPRDEYSVRLRELTDNPGAVRASSRIDLADVYGNAATWTVDTFRANGQETAFVQRMSKEEPLRLMLPPKVMAAVTRQHDALTGQMRARGARQAVATRLERGDTLGNPEALRLARKTPRKRKSKKGRRKKAQ